MLSLSYFTDFVRKERFLSVDIVKYRRFFIIFGRNFTISPEILIEKYYH